jgi:hypothetical protein
MRDFTGRELVKLNDVKEGDTLEVRAGAMQGVEPGTYNIQKGMWGFRIDTGNSVHYLEDWPYEYDSNDDVIYLNGVYRPEPKEPVAMPTTTLSEDEMRDFFARMVSTIVGYSKQAEELKGVQAQIAELAEKFSRQSEYVIRLEANNQNLKDQVAELTSQHVLKNTEIVDLKAERDLYVEQNANLHEQVKQMQVEMDLQHTRLVEALDTNDAKDRDIQDRDHRISELQEQLRLVMEDRDNTSALYSETRDKLAESERKLRGVEDAIRNVNESFSSLRAVS